MLYFRMHLCTFISECIGLDPTWDNLKTETTFPVVFGTVVEVYCYIGYKLEGSNNIACDRDTTFTFVEQPACIQLSFQTLRLIITVLSNSGKYSLITYTECFIA